MYVDEEDNEPIGYVVNYALWTSVQIEPSNYDQAFTNDFWLNTLEVKITSINKNDSWDLMELP